MFPIRNITFDPIGLWLLKWIMIPLLILWFSITLVDLEIMKYKGKKLCEEYGYIESSYIPPNRVGYGEKYIFRKKVNPDGSIDETAKRTINLD